MVTFSAEYLVTGTERETSEPDEFSPPHPFSFNYDASAISYTHIIHLVLLTGTQNILTANHAVWFHTLTIGFL